MPQLWVVAGPNGAGKSTLTRRYLEGRLRIVNPDVIAQELAPRDATRMPIRLQAGREALRIQEALLAQGLDFTIETTLSGRREMALLLRAREAGYKVTLVYVGINAPSVAQVRISQRVASGGHHIPPEDVARRYHRSLQNLAPALQRVDRAFILDNSGRRQRLLLAMERGRIQYLSRNLPLWVHTALPAALIQSWRLDS